MSVLDVMEPQSDVMTTSRKPAPAAPTDDQSPGVLAGLGAVFRSGSDAMPAVQERRLDENYAQLLNAVTEKNGKNYWDYVSIPALLNPFDRTSLDREALWRDLGAVRQSDPTAFAGVESNRTDFERRVVSRGGLWAQDAATAARAPWWERTLGGLAAGIQDPHAMGLGIATGGVGEGVGLVRGVLAAGAVNAGIAAGELPWQRQAERRLGEDPSWWDSVKDVGAAAVFGGALHGAFHASNAAAIKAIDTAAPGFRAYLQTKGMELPGASPAEVIRAYRDAVPEHLWTPDEAAAVHVGTREAEIDAINPYEDTAAGQAANRERLAAAAATISDPDHPATSETQAAATTGGAPPPPPPPSAPAPGRPRAFFLGGGSLPTAAGNIYMMLRGHGIGEVQARGIAAGVFAESKGDPNAFNPAGGGQGALGIGQWRADRQRAIVARYGAKPSLEQQVEFLVGELRGGHPAGAKVLAGQTEGEVVQAYIRDFMHPKVGPQTEQDIARAMAALEGRGAAPGAPGEAGGAAIAGEAGAGGDEAVAAAAEQAQLGAEEAAVAPAPRQGEANFDLPPLKREPFESDEEHALAQAEADAAKLGNEQVVYPPREEAPPTEPARAAEGGTVGGGENLSQRDRIVLKAVDEINKLVERYKDDPTFKAETHGTMPDWDRGRARLVDAHMDELPEDVQQFLATQKAFDQETGETHLGADTIRGTHMFNLYDEADQIAQHYQDMTEGGPGAAVGAAEAAPGETGPRMAPGVDTPEGLWNAQLARGFAPRPVFGVVGKDGAITGWEGTRGLAEARAARDGGTVTELAPEQFGVADPRQMDMTSERFSDPVGAETKAQVEGLSHTVQTAVDSGAIDHLEFQVSAGRGPEKASAALDRLDADEAALKALRNCL